MSEEAHIAAGEVWRWRPMQWRVCPVDSLYGKVLWTRPQMLPFNYSAPLIRFFFSFNKCEWLSLRQGCWNKQGHFWRGSDDSLCVDVMSRDSVIGLIMKGISARVVVFSDNSGSNGIQGRCSWETLLKVTIQLYFIFPPPWCYFWFVEDKSPAVHFAIVKIDLLLSTRWTAELSNQNNWAWNIESNNV